MYYVNVRTFVFRWTESMIPSWHTMGECFVKWLADWLKCWMRQRRKSTMRYSLENFCCISLKIFGEPDTPIRIYAHPSNPVKQSEKCLAKLMSGKKTCVFLSAAGLLFWKNWKELTFNTCHCCRFSNGDIDKLLRNYWNHMFSVDVERDFVRWKWIWVKLICEERATGWSGGPVAHERPLFDVWTRYKCDSRQEAAHFDSHFPLLRVGW